MAKKVELCDTAKDGGIGGTSAPYSERKTKNGKNVVIAGRCRLKI